MDKARNLGRGKGRAGGLDYESIINDLQIRAEQQEERLQDVVEQMTRLQEDNKKLREINIEYKQEVERLQVEKSKLEQSGCCCFQFCQIFFGKDKGNASAGVPIVTVEDAIEPAVSAPNSISSNNHFNNRRVISVQ